MKYCVYIDLGDGDFIKPNFSSPPTPQMIEDAKLKAEGKCISCRGKGTTRRRDLDSPGFVVKDLPCSRCNGTGKTPAPKPAEKEGDK